jgi:hypothetical protein
MPRLTPGEREARQLLQGKGFRRGLKGKPIPPRLKARGISVRTWNTLTPAQQRDVAKQSDALARKMRPVSRETQRRRIYRRSNFSDMPSRLRHTRSFQKSWLDAYGDHPNINSVQELTDQLYDFAKREDTEEAWQAFREVYNQWGML